MISVDVKFESGREWIMIPRSIPSASITSRDAKFDFFKTGNRLPVGEICVECMRNDKGVLVSVVLPNGYACPTGRQAPRSSWFPMLKAYLRQWLVLSPEGRVIRIANEGIASLSASLPDVAPREYNGSVSLVTANGEKVTDVQAAITKLEEFRALATGDLPKGASEKSILAAYYDWVVTTSASLGISQKDLLIIIEEGKKSGQSVAVPDIDVSVLSEAVQFTRFLDL